MKDHVHCGICHHAVEIPDDKTTLAVKSLAAAPKQPATGTQYAPMPQPDGSIAIVPVRVYLCESCSAEVEKQAAKSKLIVPKVQGVPT